MLIALPKAPKLKVKEMCLELTFAVVVSGIFTHYSKTEGKPWLQSKDFTFELQFAVLWKELGIFQDDHNADAD